MVMTRDYTEINKRRLLAWELRQRGMTWREVGKHLDVSDSRARQLAKVGKRVASRAEPEQDSNDG